jgi:CRP-like cAMP-binding protein
MSLDDDVAFLERVPTFVPLGRQALRILAIGAETMQLPSGAVLFYAGELADGGYVVQKGALLLEPGGTFSEGKEFIAGPGTLVGELALLADTVCAATAIAKEPTTVIRISRSLFRKMLEGYPAAALKLQEIMTERMQGFTQELIGMQRKMDKNA